MQHFDAPDKLCSSRYPAKNSAPFCGPIVAQTPPPKAIAPITDAAALSARNSISGSATCILCGNLLARPQECHPHVLRTGTDAATACTVQHGWPLCAATLPVHNTDGRPAPPPGPSCAASGPPHLCCAAPPPAPPGPCWPARQGGRRRPTPSAAAVVGPAAAGRVVGPGRCVMRGCCMLAACCTPAGSDWQLLRRRQQRSAPRQRNHAPPDGCIAATAVAVWRWTAASCGLELPGWHAARHAAALEQQAAEAAAVGPPVGPPPLLLPSPCQAPAVSFRPAGK